VTNDVIMSSVPANNAHLSLVTFRVRGMPKQLAQPDFQSGPLAGASPATDANQGAEMRSVQRGVGGYEITTLAAVFYFTAIPNSRTTRHFFRLSRCN